MVFKIFQFECMIDARGQLVDVMCHKHKRFARLTAKIINNTDAMLQISVVESVERLVKYQNFRIFHQSAGKKHKPLLSR